MKRELGDRLTWGTILVLLFLVIPFFIPTPTLNDGDDLDEYVERSRRYAYIQLFFYFMVFIVILAMIWFVAKALPSEQPTSTSSDMHKVYDVRKEADKLDPEWIWNLKEEGRTHIEIARKFNVGVDVINYLTERYPPPDLEREEKLRNLVKTPRTTPAVTIEQSPPSSTIDRSQVRQFREMGWDADRIAEFYGVDTKTLMESLKD